MELKEFLCGMACEFTFAYLRQPEDYGFTTWAELYQYAVQNNIDELTGLDGKPVGLADENKEIADSLQYWYSIFAYVTDMFKVCVEEVAE